MSKRATLNEGQRAFIPPWMTNTNIVAPCMCGNALEEGEPYMIAETNLGLKRWWHPQCWHFFMHVPINPDGSYESEE